MAEKKYFWLKLKRDFFKRHDIQIIEGMPNGKDYILFYLKLLCESVDHEGNLRFSEEIPYNESMLATITNTNVDIVRSAIKAFEQLHMIEILDDGTYFMNECKKVIGCECESAERVRNHREKQKTLQCNEAVTNCNENVTLEIDIDIEKDKKKEIYKERKVNTFQKPTLEEIALYCLDRGNKVNPDKFFDFYESKGWMIGKNKMKDWRAAVRTWEKGESEVIPYAN